MSGPDTGRESELSGYDATTIRWTDGVIEHDLEAFPALEEVDYKGHTVRAYRDRPDSVYGLFRRAADSVPDRDFVVFPEFDRRYTYSEMDERIDRLAAGFLETGIEPGDRIGLICSNRIEFAETVLACARIGAAVTPLNTRHSPRELGYMLEDADPAAVVVEEQFLEKVVDSEYDAAVPTFVVGGGDRFRAYEDVAVDGEIDVDPPAETDPFAMLYTSGTTGLPKGVPADNFHTVNACYNNATVFEFDEGMRVLLPTPLFHVTALICGLLSTMVVEGTVTFLDEYKPERFVRVIEEEEIQYSMGVPTNMILAAEKVDMDAYDTSSLVRFSFGGAPMPSDAIPRIREAFPGVDLCQSYGKTENLAGIVTMMPDEYTDDRPDSVGLPTPPVRLAIVDEEGNRLPPGEIGELAMYGPMVVEGYHDRPDRTAEEFVDGWHLSGDMAAVDEEGFVELKGRKGDMIIRGGENIYPIEVEEVLIEHEGVIEAAVTDFPDDVLGERVLAIVVPKEGTRVTEDELYEICRENLADYKVPDLFRIVDELPRNASGKVNRDELVPKFLQFGIKAGD